MMNVNGSEQFLGRQLTTLAKSMAEMVTKLQVLVRAQGVFTIPSDNIVIEETYDPLKTVSSSAGNSIKILPYFNGACRLKATGISNSTSAAFVIAIFINGVNTYSLGNYEVSTGVEKELAIDIAIKENDEIILKTVAGVGKVSNIKICFDEITKPLGVIE